MLLLMPNHASSVLEKLVKIPRFNEISLAQNTVKKVKKNSTRTNIDWNCSDEFYYITPEPEYYEYLVNLK